MDNSIMTDWHPGKGDYVKQNAMEDSKRRKKSEFRTVLIISGLLISIIVLLVVVFGII